MSNLTVKGNASGTGTVILEAPNTNSNRTITLPDATATLATTDDLASVASVTHLGTITTTSGSSVTLSGLTLTSYKFLQFFINGVSGATNTGNQMRLNGYLVANVSTVNVSNLTFGQGTIDLFDGVFGASSVTYDGTTPQAAVSGAGLSGVTTASTSITFTLSSATFDAGSIRIYGVK